MSGVDCFISYMFPLRKSAWLLSKRARNERRTATTSRYSRKFMRVPHPWICSALAFPGAETWCLLSPSTDLRAQHPVRCCTDVFNRLADSASACASLFFSAGRGALEEPRHYSCAVARLICLLEYCSHVLSQAFAGNGIKSLQSCHCWARIIAGNACSMLEGAIAVVEVASFHMEESDLFSKAFLPALLRSP